MTVQSATAFDRLEAAAKAAGQPDQFGLWTNGGEWRCNIGFANGSGEAPDDAVDSAIRSVLNGLHAEINRMTSDLGTAHLHASALRRLGYA